MASLNRQDPHRTNIVSTQHRSTALGAAIPVQHPQINWMAVSFGLMGIIVGFSLHSLVGGNVQAATTNFAAPPTVAAAKTELPVIRPPDPNAVAQGGGCGGCGTAGGGCGGGAQGGGCGAGGCGGGVQGGGCGAQPQPAPSAPSQS